MRIADCRGLPAGSGDQLDPCQFVAVALCQTLPEYRPEYPSGTAGAVDVHDSGSLSCRSGQRRGCDSAVQLSAGPGKDPGETRGPCYSPALSRLRPPSFPRNPDGRGTILNIRALPVWFNSHENGEEILKLFPELEKQKSEWLMSLV